MAGADFGPAENLGLGDLGEALGEPVAHQGVELGEGGKATCFYFSGVPRRCADARHPSA